jgi:glycosyltransferase involved in cell wall biosynthesis
MSVSDILVSIIVPTYNQSKYIAYTLESIKNQTYLTWECIIVDDDSNDGTKELVEAIIKDDSRFKYFHKKNEGVAAARNYGFSKARGKYVQFLDSDDYLAKERLQRCLEIMENDSQIDLTITSFRMFVNNIEDATDPFCDLSSYTLSFETVLLNWDRGIAFPPHSVFLKKEAVENVRFNEKTRYKEDWIYWIDVLKEKKNIYFLNEELAYYRMNPNGKHKKSIENFANVSNLIYQELNDHDKALFFDRMVQELTETKRKLQECSYYNDEKEVELTRLREKSKPFLKRVYVKIKKSIRKMF